MGKGRTTIQQPDAIDPGKAMGEYLFGSDFGRAQGITDPMLQDRLIEAEKRFRPQYTALELAEQEAALFGRDGQAGLIELQRRAAEEAAPIEDEAKEREIARLKDLGGEVTEAFRAADPQATRLADLAAQQAETLFAEGEGELSPERRRMAEQAARAGSLSRGRIGDQSSVAAELLGREQVRSGLRAEARQAGASAFGQTRQVGAAQADATRSSGLMSALGAIGGGYFMGKCWVAREVYGIENPKWLMFRTWLENDAPAWFRNLYIKYGERFAKFISNKPVLKTIIRKWMNTRIK